jgi:signal transduction histidine kinase
MELKLPENVSRLLTRQYTQILANQEVTEQTLEEFLDKVNKTYIEFAEDRKFYERAERISNRELDELNGRLTEKLEFLDTFNHGLAHDVMNHTANLKGLSNMLLKYVQKNNLEMINEIALKLVSSSSQLSNIVYGVLNLSKIEHKNEIEYTLINLAELIQEIDTEINYLKIGKNVSINYRTDGLKELHFSNAILRLILVNLISNAIKYSKPNLPVIVNVSIFKSINNLTIIVEDNGIGMDIKETNHKLYNLFYQSTTEKAKGYGVGLFLVKKLVDKLNGQIIPVSKAGEGTKMTIKLILNETNIQ